MKNRALIWPFSFYFLFYAGVASFGPYRVLYYQSLSFTGAQIGLLVGITPLITLVSVPLMTGLADRTNRHGLIMSLSLLAVVLGLVLLPTLKTFMLLFAVAILFSIFFSPIMPLSNSATMFMLGDKRELYGRIRLGGTIGFGIVATVAGSLAENNGLKIAFWSAAGFFFIAFVVSQKLVHGGEESGKSVDRRGTGAVFRQSFHQTIWGICTGGILDRDDWPAFFSACGCAGSSLCSARTAAQWVQLPPFVCRRRNLCR
jgi:MFS family permease